LVCSTDLAAKCDLLICGKNSFFWDLILKGDFLGEGLRSEGLEEPKPTDDFYFLQIGTGASALSSAMVYSAQ
jgi:hypothetical protein